MYNVTTLAHSFLIGLVTRTTKNSENDQEISQTADKIMAPPHRGEEPHNNHETPGRQTKQNNQLSLPHQDDCKTRMEIKSCTRHRTVTDSHNGSSNKQKVINNRTLKSLDDFDQMGCGVGAALSVWKSPHRLTIGKLQHLHF